MTTRFIYLDAIRCASKDVSYDRIRIGNRRNDIHPQCLGKEAVTTEEKENATKASVYIRDKVT